MDKIEEEYSPETIKIFLLLISVFAAFRHEIELYNFKEEITKKNRFFPDTKIIDFIKEKAELATKIINKDTKYFRARLYEENYWSYLWDIFFRLNEKDLERLRSLFSDNVIDKAQLYQHLNEMLVKWKLEEFKGYDENNSMAPPANLVVDGRANPLLIRYLYMADSIKTAIYEVRPMIKQLVSVAKMNVKEELKIYDFTISVEEETPSKIKGKSLFNVIGEAFATPVYNNKNLYIPTQYLAEYIKNLGFDGIQFNSSLHKDGRNIVVFDPEKCEAINSNVYDVKDIHITTKKNSAEDLFQFYINMLKIYTFPSQALGYVKKFIGKYYKKYNLNK